MSDSIISMLETGPLATKEVVRVVQKTNHVTIQAVYKEIKKLAESGKILLHKHALSLNLLYITKEYERWSNILNHYDKGPNLKNHFLDLREGEHISLKFKSLNDLDAYWVHAFLIIDKQNTSIPISYSIIPHDWFSYGRQETDIFWTKSQKTRSRIIVTGSEKLDKELARKRISEGFKLSASVNPLKQDDTTYFTLVNGYIFKITLDSKIYTLLNNFIKQTESIAKIDYKRVHEIINTPCVCTMKILKHTEKFEKMVSKCKKYFA